MGANCFLEVSTVEELKDTVYTFIHVHVCTGACTCVPTLTLGYSRYVKFSCDVNFTYVPLPYMV